MAIKQEITNITGATTEYHRIAASNIDYTERKAAITVLSYLDSAKREEEKNQALSKVERQVLMDELDELVADPTDENEARRIELSEQINALPQQSPEDVSPRYMIVDSYIIDLPQGIDFTLEFAYGWLKENVYTNAEDC